jgi:penicillin-binding protein 2
MSREWNNRTFPTRRNIFLGAAGIAAAGVTIRLADMQILRSHEFDEKARDNQIRLDPAPPHRGTIYDRAGRPIASNKRTFYVTLTPEQVGDIDAVTAAVDHISTILPIGANRRRTILRDARNNPKYQPILVADDLTWEDFAKINARAPELSGVNAEVGEQRSYPFYAAFYHTVGYVGRPNDADILRMATSEQQLNGEDPQSEAGRARFSNIRRLYLHPQMRVGKQGVEAYAEQQLKGKPGKTAQLVNSSGRIIEPVPTSDIQGEKGTDLVLSLDAELQNYAIQRFGQESGAAVVIDIKTGEIVVMMSTPGPDPNEFVSGLSNEYWATLQPQATERAPLIHKAYEGIYAPGSTFKIVVASAALETGRMSPEDRVICRGRAFYYTRNFACWRPEGHGWMNLHTGLQHSCDCYFYEAAKRTGVEEIAAMARRFGFGHRFELGLTGGKPGIVGNNEWKRNTYRERWYDGDTISYGIGQGYIAATPLQLAVMCARVAGGPASPRPTLVASGVDVPDQTIPPMDGVSEATLALVRAGMFAVTSESGGTATSFGALDPDGRLPAPYTNARMAGKSGSAQVRAIAASERNAAGKARNYREYEWAQREHAHFVAYAPADNPRYAIAITVEHGGSGSQVAAPFAHDILAEVLKADPGNKPRFTPQRQVAAAEQART